MKSKTELGGAVTMDPEILGGAPVFTGTRVPVENLFDFLSGGCDLDGFLRAFPRVKREHAQKVLDASSSSLLAELGVKAA
jgi:uncharacterized protein (DUF433 family)